MTASPPGNSGLSTRRPSPSSAQRRSAASTRSRDRRTQRRTRRRTAALPHAARGGRCRRPRTRRRRRTRVRPCRYQRSRDVGADPRGRGALPDRSSFVPREPPLIQRRDHVETAQPDGDCEHEPVVRGAPVRRPASRPLVDRRRPTPHVSLVERPPGIDGRAAFQPSRRSASRVRFPRHGKNVMYCVVNNCRAGSAEQAPELLAGPNELDPGVERDATDDQAGQGVPPVMSRPTTTPPEPPAGSSRWPSPAGRLVGRGETRTRRRPDRSCPTGCGTSPFSETAYATCGCSLRATSNSEADMFDAAID